MMAATRLGLLAALSGLALALTGCPPASPPPLPDGGLVTDECFDDTDCPDDKLFFCNTTTSKCEPACRTKSDCSASVRGDYKLDYCEGNLGCQCDEGKCVGSLCSSDLDCGSQVCRNGSCVDAPAVSAVSSCRITPDLAVLRPGAKAKFWVSTWAGATPVVLKDGVSWTAAGSSLTGSGAGLTQEFTAAATNTAVGPAEAVTATIGTVSCSAQAIVLPNPSASDKLAVVVLDELSGRPIEGATVLASSAAGADLDSGTTDAKGFKELTIPNGNSTVSVTAFHNDYSYLTIGNYAFSANADRFLSIVVRRNQNDKYGGYKGGFKNVPASSNVHAGIAGMSLAGSIVDLSVSQLLGPSVPTDIKIGSAIDEKGVPLPAGAFLGFTDTKIKDSVSAQGLAGVCYSSGAPNETAIKNGTCGTRTAWALAGDVPLGELPIDAFAGGTDNLDFGKVLSRIIPVFKKFNSSIVRDVEFTLKTTPKDADGNLDYSDTTEFTAVDHDFTQVPLAFNFVARSPDLPKLKGTYADGVVLLGGASVPGQGVVPLGLGAAVNTSPADAKTDLQSELAGPGLISLRMAPTHHGIEGAEYGVIALAVSLKSTDASTGLATSALYGRIPQNQLQFDPKGSKVVDLPGAYPAFPENAKYNFTNRTFKFTSDPGLTGMTVVRVVISDKDKHDWVVLLDPAQATTGVTLPAPPGAFADRTFYTGLNTGSRSTMYVQTIRLSADPGSATGGTLTFQELVEHNSTNADRLADFTTGFSLLDYSRPAVSWMTPNGDNKTVAPGSAVKVKVSYFKVGTAPTDDGFVKLTFANGPVGCLAVDADTDASNGKGEISITLPAGCTGANIQMTATLHDANGPIAPAVSSSVTANIQ